jgi:hypothetical protein
VTSRERLLRDVVRKRGPWIAFTPTVTQGVAITTTVTFAAYALLDNVAHVQMRLVLGSAGTAGADVVVGLPVAARRTDASGLADAGGGVFFDASVPTFRVLRAQAVSTTTVKFFSDAASDFFGANPAITIANGDIVTLNLMYEVSGG